MLVTVLLQMMTWRVVYKKAHAIIFIDLQRLANSLAYGLIMMK